MNTKLLAGVLVAGALGLVLVMSMVGDDDGSVPDEAVVGEEMANEVALPADLPANIPLYPDAILKRVQEAPAEGTRNITLTLETGDSVADVNTWYRGALSADPWAVTSDRNVGGYILLKGENDNVAVFTQAANLSEQGGAVITQRIQIK